MGVETVSDLGEIGTVGGILRPLVLTVERDGEVWDLTGYTDPELRVWDLRTKTIVSLDGSATISDAESGEVTYTPGEGDAIHANSGVYEGRVWVTPSDGDDPEPSGLFRFRVAAGPGPS